MQPELEGYASALLGSLDGAALAAVSEDLTSLERTVLANRDLHAVLTDTVIAPLTRARVVDDLLRGKVHDVVVRLVSYAASHVPAQDVPHSIAELAVMAREWRESGEWLYESLGLLASRHRVAGFADAMLENFSTEGFAAIETGLFEWARAIEASAELRQLLLDRDAPLSARLGITDDLLRGRVDDVGVRLARFVIEGGRARDVVGTLDFLVDYVARVRDWRVARVHSARPLDGSSREALEQSLATLTGKSVELQVTTEADLLGGVLVEVGDLRLDATTRGRLGLLRDAVTAGRHYESMIDRND